jgi:hypothetical protein
LPSGIGESPRRLRNVTGELARLIPGTGTIRKPIGNDTPDERRIVYDSENFFVNPDDFLGFEGTWYVGTTDKIAFVVRVPMLDTNSISAN